MILTMIVLFKVIQIILLRDLDLMIGSSDVSLLPLQRHRLVNDTLKEELASGVHALSIQVIFPTGSIECTDKFDLSYHISKHIISLDIF